MASESTPPKYFARDVVAYSDAELDRYLKEHYLDGGEAIEVDVEDPENLPASFIQRLRDWAQRASDADQSRPVDPDQLASRLHAFGLWRITNEHRELEPIIHHIGT